MSDNNFDLTIFRWSIGWLEKHIEQAKYFSDWKQRQQTNPDSQIKWKPNAREALACLGTNLQVEFANNGKGKDRKSPEFREAVKTEFYKWIDAVRIDKSCPKELKLVLWGVYEVIKDQAGGYKLATENSKPEVSPDSPEYQRQLKDFFSSVYESHRNGKAFEEDKGRFDGDATSGKATLEEIINSLTQEEKDNFHFWPQMTDQEKEEEDRKDKEQDNQVDPILQSWRTSAISEITNALNEARMTNNELEPNHQNWEIVINHSEDIVEIANYSKMVLSDIKKKKKQFYYQPIKNPYHSAGSGNHIDCFKFNYYFG